MRKERRKLNQSGMTLIEMVVVVLIIGILSIGTGVGVSYVNRLNASSAAEKLNSMLGRTKVLTLSSVGEVKFEISLEGDTYYGTIYENSTQLAKEKLGNSALEITAKDGVTSDVVVSGTPCVFAYSKSNGAFKTPAGSSVIYSSVVIEGAETRTVQLVKATGRSYLK